MKKYFSLLIIALLTSARLSAQTLPDLNESNLLHSSDLGKKYGWIKVQLDSAFRVTENAAQVKYEYYDFVNARGVFSINYRHKPGFIKVNSETKYVAADPTNQSKLLNGSVDFYDENGHRFEKYIFRNGFYVKLYLFGDWSMFKKKYNGKLNGVLEFAPTTDNIESWGNYFDENGKYVYDSHEKWNAPAFKNYISLPIRDGMISREDLLIEKVWYEWEYDSYKYRMFIDEKGHSGERCASIRSIDKKINGSGALLQNCLAQKFAGKRIRITVYLKMKDVEGWANTWLQFDQRYVRLTGPDAEILKRGTSDWKKYEIVADVPPITAEMYFGAILHGTGQIWIDDFSFETVDSSVAVTGVLNESDQEGVAKEPTNLSFEKK